MPNYANNADYVPKTLDDTTIAIPTARAPDSTTTPLEADTIIAGVIDVGIPLGHNRWRFSDGKTRVLSAWQMMAPWDLKEQAHLPFGAEFTQSEINTLLKKHSGNQQNGWLNEHDFNVETGVVDFVHRQAQRGAAGQASHGAHVLDLVAGMDPATEEDFQKRVRIIAINAPTAAVFKAAGTYLDAYMLYAIQRIADIADKAWRDKNPNSSKTKKGFPIVINMSFGKQAGSKDALDEFPAKLARFVKDREASGWSKVRFVMPAGNDNLDRCNAILEPKKGAIEKLNWRILPQDHSANYVEVWGNDAGNEVMSLSLKPPHAEAQFLGAPPVGGDLHFRNLYHNGIVVARVYYSRVSLPPENGRDVNESDNPIHKKYRYVLCTAPTHRADEPQMTAPSGQWEIAVKNLGSKQEQVVLSVQTDQALSASDGKNLRSYFDDPHYERFGEEGGWLESYAFPPDHKSRVENLDIRTKTPVRRHGTMNASAAHGVVARVGGYRVTDRRPAPYSSTGRGRESGQDDGTVLGSKLENGRKGAPTASFPTDDSPAHFGILAAGAANGSVAAMRGTSFASAQGAREIINKLMKGNHSKSGKELLLIAAKAAEKASNHPIKFSDDQIDVLGGGRIDRPDKQKIDRF
ncbi:MAG: hypothetical protein GQ535_05230 [Rhodobacteraceae bacterium]|nr:hypothetical protein [Paracoccaceae bacterium]